MAKLTAQQRKRLPSSSFVFPGKRAYPLDTKNRARNALARVAQHGSSSEKAKVRAAVHSKYPDIGEGRMLSSDYCHCGHREAQHHNWSGPCKSCECNRFKFRHYAEALDALVPWPPVED